MSESCQHDLPFNKTILTDLKREIYVMNGTMHDLRIGFKIEDNGRMNIILAEAYLGTRKKGFPKPPKCTKKVTNVTNKKFKIIVCPNCNKRIIVEGEKTKCKFCGNITYKGSTEK